jgi:hypothetical protein
MSNGELGEEPRGLAALVLREKIASGHSRQWRETGACPFSNDVSPGGGYTGKGGACTEVIPSRSMIPTLDSS